MKHKITIIAVLLSTLNLFADENNFSRKFNKSSCKEEVQKQIDAKLQRQFWLDTYVSLPSKPLVDAVEFRDTAKRKVYYFWNDETVSNLVEIEMSSNSQILKTWDSKNKCAIQAGPSKIIRLAFQKFKGEFSDASLFDLLKKNPSGLIYVWSPYMPLSVEAIPEILKAAAENKLPVTVLLDGKSSVNEAKAWQKKKPYIKSEYLKKVSSDELFSRNMSVHYPILFYYDKQFLSNRTYIGHKTADIYDLWIKKEIANLNEDFK